MLAMAEKQYRDVVNLEQYADDGRLTEPTNGKRYDWRKMIDTSKKLGRPLSGKEVEIFRMR